MKKLISILTACLLIITMIPLSSCSSKLQTSELPPLDLDGIVDASNIEEAMEAVQRKLQSKDSHYQMILRDQIEYQEAMYDCLWLYAINNQSECLDVILSSDYNLLKNLITKVDPIQFYRKNEIYSYNNRNRYPHHVQSPLCGGAGIYTSKNGEFYFILTGNAFAVADIQMIVNSSVYWDGKYQVMASRPAVTVAPEYKEDPSYPIFTPEETIEESVQAVINRLEATGLGYEWETQDTITLDGTDYPVVWLYAIDDKGEWVDVIWSEDPDFCYFLSNRRDVFTTLRQDEITAMNATYPQRGEATFNMNAYLLQDVFYHGYSMYMEGYGLSLLDCGSVFPVREYDEKTGSIATYFTRNEIYQ